MCEKQIIDVLEDRIRKLKPSDKSDFSMIGGTLVSKKKVIEEIRKIRSITSSECTLTDEELIDECMNWILKLCENPNNWILRVPARHNRDPDLLFSELIKRFKKAKQKSKSENEY